jgi:hypothetical protein
MAQTETKPGFKLPWTADRPDADPPADDATGSAAPHDPPPHQEPETPDMIDVTTPAPARRTTKLMADLSRAMQTAAESARDETVARFITDSKTAVEEIQAAAQVEAADLRRRADDDVAVVREWSKAEIARIREETEARIAARKQALDGEIDAHAAVVETRVQRVGATVEAFQAEMDEFFERLLAEQDPTRIATMAETMPEPPDLAGLAASITEADVAPSDPMASSSSPSNTVRTSRWPTRSRRSKASGHRSPARPTASCRSPRTIPIPATDAHPPVRGDHPWHVQPSSSPCRPESPSTSARSWRKLGSTSSKCWTRPI